MEHLRIVFMALVDTVSYDRDATSTALEIIYAN